MLRLYWYPAGSGYDLQNNVLHLQSSVGCYVYSHVNTLRPRQDGRHFADDIFVCIFFNEKCCILIKCSLKYVRKGPIDNNPALVQIMAWRRSGDKPLSEPMMINLPTHICVTRPQWVLELIPKLRYQFLYYHDENLSQNCPRLQHGYVCTSWVIWPDCFSLVTRVATTVMSQFVTLNSNCTLNQNRQQNIHYHSWETDQN